MSSYSCVCSLGRTAWTLQRNVQVKTDFLSYSYWRGQMWNKPEKQVSRVLPKVEPSAPSSSSADTLAPIFGDTQKPLFQMGSSPVSSSSSTVPCAAGAPAAGPGPDRTLPWLFCRGSPGMPGPLLRTGADMQTLPQCRPGRTGCVCPYFEKVHVGIFRAEGNDVCDLLRSVSKCGKVLASVGCR